MPKHDILTGSLPYLCCSSKDTNRRTMLTLIRYDIDTLCISILACSAGSLHAASNPHHHVSATRLLPVHRQEISGSKKPHHYQAIMLHGAGLLDSFRTTNEQYRPPYHGTRGKDTSGFDLSLHHFPFAKPSPGLGSNGTAMFTTTLGRQLRYAAAVPEVFPSQS